MTVERHMVTVHLELWLDCSGEGMPIVKSILIRSEQHDAQLFNTKYARIISASAQGSDRIIAEENLRKQLEEDPLIKPLMPLLRRQNHWH